MNWHISRRAFLRQTALGLGGLGIANFSIAAARKVSPNEKLNIGAIGVANRAGANLAGVSSQNIVALCDVDDGYLAAAAKRHPGAKTYHDFRRLLDQPDLDAVLVGTADHTHAVAAVAALNRGLHVYCEKPLTRTISECRAVMEAAKKNQRVTQMGTQIHADTNYRRVVELVRSGVIGSVAEVHVWVNVSYPDDRLPRTGVPIPESLHYDLWLGPVPERPYSPDYHPGSWRRWWAFGGGGLADFGCHYMDLPHWALELRSPLSAEIIEGKPPHPESIPSGFKLRYQYPARGEQPPVKLTWYHGGRTPGPDVLPAELVPNWRSGVLFIGSKGNLLADYSRRQLLPEARFKDFVAPAPTIPDSIGHHEEWILACKTGGPTTCNFDYSGSLTEAVLLGNVAYRAQSKIEWDSKNLKATNCPAAAEFIHHQYRKGWQL